MTKTAERHPVPEDAKAPHYGDAEAGTAVAVTTPTDLLRMAVEQNADLDKLSKLMDLQERWEANEARKAYVAALNAFKANPPTIGKNKHVDYPSKGGRTEYDHATLDNVCEKVGKALGEHGVSFRWETQQSENARVTVTCVLTHALGHSERTSLSSMPDDSGGKNSIQAIGSAVTYLQRYTLLAITGLATSDQDYDGDGVTEKITANQKEALIAMQIEVGADTAAFLKYLEVESLDDLPAEYYDNAVKALETKRKKGTANG
jgi:hypothetical protein